MNISELDRLDILKRKLEIKKIQAELNTEHFFPSKKIAVWQALAPSLLTLISILLAGIILLGNNVFETNNKLLSVEKENLKLEVADFKNQKNNLESKNAELIGNNNNLKIDSSYLANKIIAYNSELNDTINSMSEQQKNIADLKFDNNVLRDENDFIKNENADLLRKIQTLLPGYSRTAEQSGYRRQFHK